MNAKVGKFLEEQAEQQQQAHRDFCGFTSDPTNVEDAILEILDRFPEIQIPQIVALLTPWFDGSEVEISASGLLGEGRLGIGLDYRVTRRSN